MSQILLVPPALEPVSLTEARTHLRVDQTVEDEMISRLLTTARQQIERLSSQFMIRQSWAVYFDKWPLSNIINLPLGPVLNVTGIKVYDADNQALSIDTTQYVIDATSKPARLLFIRNGTLPQPGRQLSGIEILLDVGFGSLPTNVPEPLRQAILLLTAHWFENRCAEASSMPDEVARLASIFQTVRL